jgi:hypothetical protein
MQVENGVELFDGRRDEACPAMVPRCIRDRRDGSRIGTVGPVPQVVSSRAKLPQRVMPSNPPAELAPDVATGL